MRRGLRSVLVIVLVPVPLGACSLMGLYEAPVSECGEGQIECDLDCVEPMDDPEHCGDCATVCETGELCEDGECACLPHLTECDDRCVDTETDPEHCGDCSAACGGGEVCTGGTCGADCSLAVCDFACVDSAVDVLHCGDRCLACQGDQICHQGECRDYEPALGCTTTCVACGCPGDGCPCSEPELCCDLYLYGAVCLDAREGCPEE